MSIKGEVQGFNSGQWVELYSLDLVPFGGDLMSFYAGTNEVNQPIVWQGVTYTAYPCEVTGFSMSSTGAVSRPKLKLANVNGVISTVLMQSGGIEGARFVRKRTKTKFLDAVNFLPRRNLLLNSSKLSTTPWSASTSAPATLTTSLWRGEFPFYSIVKVLGTSNESRNQTLGAKAIGATQTVSLVLRAGTSTTASVGISANTGWGSNTDSSAVVISGPGVIARQTGAVFAVSNLSDVPTRISITRYFPVAATACTFNIYPGSSTSTIAGQSILVTAAQSEVGAVASEYQDIGSSWSQNPTADPTAGLPDDVFYVTRKETDNPDVVALELGPSTDLQGVSIPGRVITASYCPFKYRQEACGYTGPAVATITGSPTTNLALDRCGKKLSDCKLRFGTNSELPFGGFPACGLVRFT